MLGADDARHPLRHAVQLSARDAGIVPGHDERVRIAARLLRAHRPRKRQRYSSGSGQRGRGNQARDIAAHAPDSRPDAAEHVLELAALLREHQQRALTARQLRHNVRHLRRHHPHRGGGLAGRHAEVLRGCVGRLVGDLGDTHPLDILRSSLRYAELLGAQRGVLRSSLAGAVRLPLQALQEAAGGRVHVAGGAGGRLADCLDVARRFLARGGRNALQRHNRRARLAHARLDACGVGIDHERRLADDRIADRFCHLTPRSFPPARRVP